MDQSSAEVLIIVLNLFGLILPIFGIVGGLEYFIASVGVIIFINLLIIGGYIATNRSNSEKTSVNPVNSLQERFAEGELTQEEFERKLDQMVETQDIADEVDDENIELLSKN